MTAPAADPLPSTAADAAPGAPHAARAYRERAAAHHAAARVAERQARWAERARLVAFVAGLFATWTANERRGAATAVAVAAVAGLLLAAMAAAHARVRRRARWHFRLAEVCEQGEARVLRRWDRLDVVHIPVPDDHPYAADLSLTGRASLWQLLGTVSAYPGRDALAAWLLDPPAPAAEIRARQAAARALAPAAAWREALAAHALAAGAVRRDGLARFLTWAEEAPGALARWVPYALACVSPAVLVGAALAWGAWPGAGPVASRVAAGALAVNLALSLLLRKRTTVVVRDVTRWSGGLRQHAALLRHASSAPSTTPDGAERLGALAAALSAGGGAARAAERLERVAACAEARYSPMAYALLQAALLWDAHVAAAVERWRRDAGARARAWFAALGELEALSALATLAHDNPGWAFPDVDDGAETLDAEGLAHPLLAEGTRVANDVAVGPAGTVLLVTGSNMAGKSTLLRAVALNAVLAQSGGPACATRLRTPRLRVMTSVAVRDSLAEETSLFLAELKRVKRIVDAAREPGPAPPVLYLLDEVLHGTNSAERRVATRAVLSHLLAARAVGAVSTHDLALAEDEPLASAARLVHFTETVRDGGADGGARMTFDYRLRPGLATSTNALVLLRLLGLGTAGPVERRRG